MIRRKWIADNSNTEKIKELSVSLGIDESIVRILVQRGIDNKESIEEFLNPSYEKLYDPFLLNDMDKAVKRINTAINKEEKIFIYGDYDVDGVTASSILYMALKSIHNNVYIYIPERENEGYGLNKNAIDKIYKAGGNLIITVDCGISSHSEAEYAKSMGIDMIITDHHTCPEILPPCVAVINPKRKDSTYPFSELCGAGVSLKLCSALNLLTDKLIAICAIGTVSDIVPLILENRIITYFGIKLLREGILKNINILCEVAGTDYKNISSTTIGFTIAPRINAAGRMATAKEAVEFFISQDTKRIKELSEYLNNLNLKRQECEKEIYKEAKEKIEKNKEYENNIMVVSGNGWHEGVIGIVASKITEEYYKPCIMICVNDNEAKGSSRSVRGYNIYEGLLGVSDLLIKFGGHSLAAGLSIDPLNIDKLREKINENAKEIFENGDISPFITIDAELKENNINLEYTENLKKLEPFGMGNPQPLFLIKDSLVKESYSFSSGKHMRLNLLKEGVPIEAVGFNMGQFTNSLKTNQKIHLLCTIDINEFKGIKKVQAKVKDIRI